MSLAVPARLLALLALLVAGCTADGAAPGVGPTGKEPAAVTGSVRYLALGDSYTIGERVAEDHRWPVQLVAALRAEGIDLAEPQIIARTGWTTGELDGAIDRVDPKGPFDLVSLLIGVNDQFRGRPLDAYRPAFERLLARAIAFADGRPGRVVVLSIPDYGVTPFARPGSGERIGREIDEFNAAKREITEAAGARWVDITPISRRAADDRSLIASDGLHPSGVMYTEWTAAALPAARQALTGE